MTTATAQRLSEIPRINLRRARAEAIVHAVLNIVDPYLCDHNRDAPHPAREVANKLLDAFMKEGYEVISDFDRAKYDLPQRGPDGWTLEEILLMEQRKLDILRAPVPMFILPGATR